MLKLGKMYTATEEYNIFILQNEHINRLEIGTSTSKWHSIDSKILYGEYTRKVFRTFGNDALGKLYKDTIKNAKTIDVLEQIDMGLVDGSFIKVFLKFLSGDEYSGFAEKDGKLYSEVCMYGGTKIVLYVSEATCNFDLEPLNFPQYKRSKRQDEIPELAWSKHHSRNYDNYQFMRTIFRYFFSSHTKSSINIDAPFELRDLLYDKLGLPVLIWEEDGTASVGTDAVRKLARMKREFPSSVIKSDIRDNNGRLVLTAKRLNSAKYPEAVYLEKYNHFKGLTEMYSLLRREEAHGVNG